MTAEHWLIFGLGDLRGVLIECDKCGTRLTIPTIGKIKTDLLESCPFCGTDWLRVHMHTNELFKTIQTLVAARKVVAESRPPFAVKLQFEEPAPSSSAPATS